MKEGKMVKGYSSIMLLLYLMLSILCVSLPTRAEASDFGTRVRSMSEITAVRTSTSTTKSRVVIDCNKESEYKVSILSNPQRIVVDISNAWLSPQVTKSTNIGSRFVQNVRIAQFDAKTVRVVAESSLGKNNIKIFTLKGNEGAFRVVMDFGDLGAGTSKGSTIDFSGGKKEAGEQGEQEPAKKPLNNNTEPVREEVSDNSDIEKDKSYIEPVFSKGIKDKVIVLDAGHGGSDVGAIGPTGVTEKSITLRIVKEASKLLSQEGAKVILTRNNDREVSLKREKASDKEELQARCDVANKAEADIFLSVHMDSFSNSTPNGTTGYHYSKGTKAGKRLAETISKAVVESLGTIDRGCKSSNFYVVRHTKMPAALLEVAFISNQREERLLSSEEGIKKAAAGIVKGIKDFFN